MSEAKSRFAYIDAARGIGILMVILGHLRFPYLTTWVYSCHIPLFFLLSGILICPEKYDFKTFIKKRIKGLVIPYLALGFGIWLFFSAVYYLDTTPPEFIASAIASPGEMLVQFLLQRHYWTVWFLACLFFAELIFFGLHKLTLGKAAPLFIDSVLLCVAAFIYYRLGGDTLPWNLDTACVAQFFICLGYLMKKRGLLQTASSNKICAKKILFTALFFCINLIFLILNIKIGRANLDMSVHLYGIEVWAVLSAFFGSLFVVSVAAWISSWKPITYLGANTMLVFAWHSRIVKLLFDCIYQELNIFQHNGVAMQCVYSIVTAAGILLILLPLTASISKTKFCWIIGR